MHCLGRWTTSGVKIKGFLLFIHGQDLIKLSETYKSKVFRTAMKYKTYVQSSKSLMKGIRTKVPLAEVCKCDSKVDSGHKHAKTCYGTGRLQQQVNIIQYNARRLTATGVPLDT